MNTLTTLLLSTILTASFTGAALAQTHEHGTDGEDQIMDMMADPDSRSMMMESIANNPEMRHQMMHKMKQTMAPDGEMSMYEMMNNPAMKERMQKHMEMMQTMWNSGEMNQEEIHKMMSDYEMKSVMHMHSMCMKMMNDGMMGEHSKHKEGGQTSEDNSG